MSSRVNRLIMLLGENRKADSQLTSNKSFESSLNHSFIVCYFVKL